MLTTLLNNATTNGSGTALDCREGNTVVLLVSGDFDAAVKFDASIDGTNWFSFTGSVNGGMKSAVVYAPCHVEFKVDGVAYVRPVVVGYKSGAVTVTGYVEARRIGAYSYQHFNATTTGTLVKTGTGTLYSINVGDAGSGLVVTVYDGTSTSGNTIAVIKTAGSYVFNTRFTAGLFVVISATTMGDVTITYA